MKQKKQDIQKENHYLELFEKMFSGVVILTPKRNGEDFTIAYFNKAAEKISKVKRDKIIGKSITKNFPGIKKAGFLKTLKEVNNTGKPQNPPPYYYEDKRLQGWRQNYVYKLSTGEIISVFDDVTHKKESEEELKYQSEFQKTVSKIASLFINTHPDKIFSAVKKSLKLVGEFFNVDRSYVFQFSKDGKFMSNTYEWCAEGIKPQISRLKNFFPVKSLPYFYKDIMKKKPLQIKDVNKLPKKAIAERKEFEAQRIKSLLILPMVKDGKVVGFLGFDSVKEKRSWDKGQIYLLSVVAEIMSNAFFSLQIEEEVKKAKERYELMFNAAQYAIATLEPPDWKFTSGNSSALKLFNAKHKEEFVSFVPWKLSPKFQPDGELSSVKAKKMINIAMKKGSAFFEWKHKRVSGEEFLASVSLSKVKMDGKNFLQAILKDVTEQKELEQKILDNEKKLKTYFEHSPYGIFIADEKGKYIDFNRAAQKITGYSSEELLSMSINDLIVPEMEKESFALVEELKNKGYGEAELLFPHKNGEKKWWSLVVNSIPGKKMMAFCIDITEQKKAEVALKESEEKHRVLFDTMEQGVVYQDSKGFIFSANPAAEKILGLSLKQMQGRTSIDPRWKSIHEDGSPFPGEDHASMVALRTGKEVKGLMMGVFNPKDNVTKWILINAVPQFRSGEKKPFQVYTTFTDVTKLKSAEKELLAKNKSLEKLNQFMLGRELKMIELKKEINHLLERAGKKKKYEA